MPPIIQELKAYLKTRFTLLKYETIEQAVVILADLLVDLVIMVSLLMAFIFFTIAFAFLLAMLFKSYWIGFGLASFLYLLILLFGHLLKKPLQNSLIETFVSKTFKKR